MSFDYQALAKQFVDFYYQQFESDRAQLGSLYRETSMLTFETNQVQGTQAIVEKLTSLPFRSTRHELATLDAQPATPGGTDVIVLVTGSLTIDGEHPQRFSQVFHLIPENGSFYVFNDLFRLQ